MQNLRSYSSVYPLSEESFYWRTMDCTLPSNLQWRLSSNTFENWDAPVSSVEDSSSNSNQEAGKLFLVLQIVRRTKFEQFFQ